MKPWRFEDSWLYIGLTILVWILVVASVIGGSVLAAAAWVIVNR